MNMMHVDTLAFTHRLESAGFKREQAEALVQGISEIDTPDVATKQDIVEVKQDIAEVRTELKHEIAEVRTELKQDIAEVRSELKQDIAEVRSELKQDIAEVKHEIGEFKSEIRTDMKWIFWIGGAILGATVLPLLVPLAASLFK